VDVLTAVATRATISIGTSCFNTPSSPMDVGKWLYNRFSTRPVPSKKKKSDILFKPIGIGSHSRTKIRFLDHCNDLGIAIWTCAIWRRFECITLTKLWVNLHWEVKKKSYMWSWKGVTIGRQLPLDHFHNLGWWSIQGEAKVDHPGTSLFHLPSEKGNLSTWLRVLVNRYPNE